MIAEIRSQLTADTSPPHLHTAFRFPARLHHKVSNYVISSFSRHNDWILDPFVGCGTNQLEAATLGRNSIGIDIDPLSAFVTRAKTQLRPEHIGSLQRLADALESALSSRENKRDYERLMFHDIVRTRVHGEDVGISADVFALLKPWFRNYVIEDLHFILSAIRKSRIQRAAKDIALLAFASAVRNCSNADPVPVSGLEYTKRMRDLDAKGRLINPYQIFFRRLRSITANAIRFAGMVDSNSTHTTELADSTCFDYGDRRFRLIFFSPPYLNAVEYSRRHKLEMAWLGLIKSHAAFIKLAGRYVGHRAIGKDELELQKLPGGTIDRIRLELLDRDYRRARAFARYCNQMRAVFENFVPTMTRTGRCVVVVGNNTVAGLEIPADEVFKDIAAPLTLVDHTRYILRNRYMSYQRRNGADIGFEHVLVFGR